MTAQGSLRAWESRPLPPRAQLHLQALPPILAPPSLSLTFSLTSFSLSHPGSLSLSLFCPFSLSLTPDILSTLFSG